MNGVPFPVRVVCNIAARELVKFLVGRRAEEVASWFKEGKDLSKLLRDDFSIPENIKAEGIKAKITRSVLKKVPARVNGSCPAYDLILQNVYDMAGLASMEMARAGHADAASAMREVQVIAAFLANDKVRPWYYENMDRLCEIITLKFGGDGDADGQKEN